MTTQDDLRRRAAVERMAALGVTAADAERTIDECWDVLTPVQRKAALAAAKALQNDAAAWLKSHRAKEDEKAVEKSDDDA